MGNFLNALSTVAGAASDIGSIASTGKAIGGLFGLFGDGTASQKKLMRYQNQLQQENATIAYDRQRELTQDTPLLNKIGMKMAGVNTAMKDGSSAGAASVGAAGGVSIPSLPHPAAVDSQYASMMSNGMNTLQRDNLSSQNRVANAQAHGIEIDNKTRGLENLERLSKMRKDGLISDELYNKMVRENKFADETYDNEVQLKEFQVKSADLDNQLKEGQVQLQELAKQMNDEQLKQLKFITDHQLEKYLKDLEEQNSRIKANNASAAASFAAAAQSRAQALLIGIQSELEKAKIPYASQLAKALSQQAQYSANKAYNEALITMYSVPGAKREAAYQTWIGNEENSWLGRNVFGNMRGVFENSLGQVFGYIKPK